MLMHKMRKYIAWYDTKTNLRPSFILWYFVDTIRALREMTIDINLVYGRHQVTCIVHGETCIKV